MVFISMTIAEAQQAFLRAGGFVEGGMDRPQANELTELEKELSNYITKFLNKASENLEADNKNSTGELDQSLSFNLVKNRNGYTINFLANKYWKFVDAGVRGSGGSRRNTTSPYTFRDKMPPMSHIKKWITDNQGTAKAVDVNRYGRTRRESRAINEDSAINSIAFLIARNIKNNGLPATNFWTNAFNETFEDFGQKMAAALGRTIVVNLEQMRDDLRSGRNVNIPR